MTGVWDRAPEWVSYATFVGGGSDKFYEVRVDQQTSGTTSGWVVTKRYGRNPDTRGGQSREERYLSRDVAETNARNFMNSKVNEGYIPRPWPHGAAAMPDFRDPEAVERWLAT